MEARERHTPVHARGIGRGLRDDLGSSNKSATFGHICGDDGVTSISTFRRVLVRLFRMVMVLIFLIWSYKWTTLFVSLMSVLAITLHFCRV